MDEIGSLKPASSYSSQVEKEVKLLSFQDSDTIPVKSFDPKKANPFGSFTLRIQKYPGDIDLHEPFVIEEISGKDYNDSRSFAAKLLAKRMQQKVRSIINSGNKSHPYVISEIKAGVDPKYAPLYSNETQAIRLSEEEIENRREKYIIRWNVEQVLKGYKYVNGRKVTLEEALSRRGHIKIDVITIIDGLFTEITNFLFFGIMIDGKLHAINTSIDFTDKKASLIEYERQLKDEIHKLFYTRLFYNPFKGVKRMFALSRAKSSDPGYHKYMYKLAPLVSGDVSQLYQVKSSLSTYILFMKTIEGDKIYKASDVAIDMNVVDKFIDKIKNMLSTNLLINQEELIEINNALDSGEIPEVVSFLSKRINIRTMDELNHLGLIPIPQLLLQSD